MGRNVRKKWEKGGRPVGTINKLKMMCCVFSLFVCVPHILTLLSLRQSLSLCVVIVAYCINSHITLFFSFFVGIVPPST